MAKLLAVVASLFNVKAAHDTLMACAQDIYDAAEVAFSAGEQVLELISEARTVLNASQFDAWVTSEFGTGGSPSADGYAEGAFPHALRGEGYMARSGKPAEGESRDRAAARVNTFVSSSRVIARKACDVTFPLEGTFNAVYKAARAKGAGSNRSKRKGKTPEAPVVTLKEYATFAHDHLPAALETIIKELRNRKETIRAAAVEAIRAQLVSNS
jgi:hypothetical protein